MLKVATSGEMRACDQIAIKQFGIPGIVLMENASRGVVDVIEREFGDVRNKSIFVFCGKGNNGGDGLAVARHLFNRGGCVSIFLIGSKKELRGDAKTNIEIVERITEGIQEGHIFELREVLRKAQVGRLTRPDMIIDALLGTGMKGSVQGILKDIIQWINECQVHTVSVDVPSGVDSDTGEVGDVAVKADVTVTAALLKRGLLFGEGRVHSGKVYIADIGAPRFVLDSHRIRTQLIEPEDILARIPERPFDAHKHTCGKVFVLAGSRGLTGAAAMCSESALRAGAGAVILGIPASLNPILETKLTEVMTVPLADTSDGAVSQKAFSAIIDYVSWADVLLIGPGLSRNKETQRLVLDLIPKIDKPTVIDADGLNALAEDPNVLKKTRASIILTPHCGELSRMIKLSGREIELNRVETARRVAAEYNVVVILKGAPTVVARPGGDVFINSTGNPGMATAGAGDVLAGVVVALLGQKLNALDASMAGVYLHGLAGDIAKENLGAMSLISTDIMRCLPSALMRLKVTQTQA
jgi:NAD(P)H-hydrate epimerase